VTDDDFTSFAPQWGWGGRGQSHWGLLPHDASYRDCIRNALKL